MYLFRRNHSILCVGRYSGVLFLFIFLCFAIISFILFTLRDFFVVKFRGICPKCQCPESSCRGEWQYLCSENDILAFLFGFCFDVKASDPVLCSWWETFFLYYIHRDSFWFCIVFILLATCNLFIVTDIGSVLCLLLKILIPCYFLLEKFVSIFCLLWFYCVCVTVIVIAVLFPYFIHSEGFFLLYYVILWCLFVLCLFWDLCVCYLPFLEIECFMTVSCVSVLTDYLERQQSDSWSD